MATQNGSALVILFDDVAIPCQTDSTSLPMERDMIETTCKDSTGSWKTFIPGEKGATIDFVANLDWADSAGLSDMFTKFDSGSLIEVKWGNTGSGEKYFVGTGYLSSLNPEGPQNDKATYSGTITISGVITEETVA